jgi:Icc-related predicted phosphoesterase
MDLKVVSDLHGHLPAISECDLLLIAGDICPHGTAPMQGEWMNRELRPWLENIPAKEIVAIFGNHDFVGHATPHLVPLGLRWKLLNNGYVEIPNGPNIWGSPYSRRFGNWAFMTDEETLAAMYSQIPEGTDIVLAHNPPKGINDMTVGGVEAGSTALLERIKVLKPQLVICGHIHEARGYTETPFGIVVNCACCNIMNQPQYGAMDIYFNKQRTEALAA